MRASETEETRLANNERYPSTLAASALVALLIIATLNANTDDRIMALLVRPIKASFKLSDTDIGLLQGLAISLFAGLLAFPIGILIDRSNRVRLVWLSVLGWSLFTALSGLSQNFWQLFFCRTIVGVTELTATAALSLIADLFPPKMLVSVMTVVVIGQVVGSSGSVTLGGLLIGFVENHASNLPVMLDSLAPWRLTLLASAAPGILVAGLLMFAREPSRKHFAVGETIQGSEISIRHYLKEHGRSFFSLCASSVLSGIGIGALLVWLPTALLREYQMPTVSSGEWLGAAYGIGSLSGLAFGAILNQIIQARYGSRGTLLILKTSIIAAAAIFPILLLLKSASQVLILTAVYVFVSFVQSGVAPGLTLYIVPNHLRGRFTALFNIVGLGISAAWPPLIGIMSDHVFHGQRGLTLALCSVAIPALFASAILVLGVTVPQGEPAADAMEPAQ